MGYIESTLMKSENIIYRTKLTKWTLTGFAWLAIFTPIAYAINTAFGSIVLIISIIATVVQVINYFTSEFAITDKRVIIKTGFIKRNSFEVLKEKVESIQIYQGIFDRILGYGKVTIIGTGGSRNEFKMIVKPLEFRRYAQEQIAI